MFIDIVSFFLKKCLLLMFVEIERGSVVWYSEDLKI